MDDVIYLVHTLKTEELQQHMDTVDPIGSIRSKRDEEENNNLPFLDTNITRKNDGSLKSLVYRKKAQTDQYLNFTSHHPDNFRGKGT